MHISRRRIISFLILFTAFLALPLTGCGSGTSGDQATSPGSPASIGKTDTAADTSTAREEEIEPAPKRLGIKPFWPYDTNAVGGGGKAMANLASGNFLLQYTDVSFPGRGLPVEIRRTYNSMNGAKGYFGKGWSCIFDSHLVFNETNGNITLIDAYGGRFGFKDPQPDGSDTVYKSPAGRNTIFKKLADGTYSEKKKNGSTYLFDTAGKLVRLQHRNNNNYIQFIYDANGFPMGIHEASGRDTSIVCDESGHITSITDPQERVTSYYYGGNRLRKVIDPHHYRTLFEYNESGLLSTITTPKSFQSSIVYDAQNRIAEFHDPLYTVSYGYFDDRTEVNDTYGHHLVYYLNGRGNAKHIVDTMGNHTYLTWDQNENVTKVKNAKDQETTSTYDAMGNVLSVTNSLFTTSYTYDSSHNLTSSTDGNGKTTTFSYVPIDDEPDGVLEHVTTPLGRTAYFTCNKYGEPIAATNPRNFTTHYAYNINGYVTRVTDAKGKVTSMAYNHVGEPRIVTDALGRKTTFAYDKNGRVTSVITPGGAVTSYGYDQHGNRVYLTNPLNIATSYAFDEDDRMVSVTDGLMKTSTYTYLNGCLASTRDPMGFTTEMTYDGNDRMTGRSNPITSESYAYDPLGNVTTKSTRLGDINYSYDGLNRLIGVTMPGRTVSYALDNNGNRTGSSVYDSTGAWTVSHMDFFYSYDDENRLTAKEKKLEGSTVERLSIGYDHNNNLTALNVTARRAGAPFNHATNPPADLEFSFAYTYNELDRQVSVYNSRGDTFSASYDDVGNMTGITYPTGTWMQQSTSTRVYDQENRISTVTNDYLPTDSGPVHIQYAYEYDKADNCTSVSIDPVTNGIPGPRIYQYDELNRLKYDRNAMMAFEYDDAGNKIKDILLPASDTALQETINYTFNNAHQLLKIESDKDPRIYANRWAYQYDVNGNTSKKTYMPPPSTVSYWYYPHVFNPMNCLISTKDCYFSASTNNHILYSETRQSFDDNDKLVFNVERKTAYGDNHYVDWASLYGYHNGTLLYKNVACEIRYNDGSYYPSGYACELEFFTYLNGIKVGKSLSSGSDTSDIAALFESNRSLQQHHFDKIMLKNEHMLRLCKDCSLSALSSRSFNEYIPEDRILLYDGQNNPVETAYIRGYPTDEFVSRVNYTSYGELNYYGAGTGTYRDGAFKGYEPGAYGYQTGVRTYDPQTGRFLQPDPFKGYLSEPASQNPYMYCRGNPVKYSDPSGYSEIYDKLDLERGAGGAYGRIVFSIELDQCFISELLGIPSKTFTNSGRIRPVFQAPNQIKDTGSAIKWLRGIGEAIKNGKKPLPTEEEVDYMVKIGRQNKVDIVRHGPHDQYKADHINIQPKQRPDGSWTSKGHIDVPSSYKLPSP